MIGGRRSPHMTTQPRQGKPKADEFIAWATRILTPGALVLDPSGIAVEVGDFFATL
jgi:hypothetical protein